MRILLVGHDTAPKRAFELLAKHLEASGHAVATAFTVTELQNTSVGWGHIVLVGMSSPKKNAEIEIETARECVKLGKPFGFYADTHGAWRRRHFVEFGDKAAFLFVVNEDEARKASVLFRNATIYATGNPLWGEYFKPASRIESRRLIGASDNAFVIVAPGTKSAVHNITVWTDVIEAAHVLVSRAKGYWINTDDGPDEGEIVPVTVALAVHPGDKTPREVYDDLLELGRFSMWKKGDYYYPNAGLIITTGKEEQPFTADRLVPGADVVVNGTSVRVHALARRIPIVDYYPAFSQRWLKRDIGDDVGPFYKSGAVVDAYGKDSEYLLDVFKKIYRNPLLLKEAQERSIAAVQEDEVLARMRVALEARMGELQ